MADDGYNPVLGAQLYDKAEKIWSAASTTPNRFGPGLDMKLLREQLMEKYYEPAASYGYAPAMMKCALYYRDRNPLRSMKYMQAYYRASQ